MSQVRCSSVVHGPCGSMSIPVTLRGRIAASDLAGGLSRAASIRPHIVPSTYSSMYRRRRCQGGRCVSTLRVSISGRQLSARGSPELGLAIKETTSYLRNLPSLSSSRKLTGYSRTHPPASRSSRSPATQTVSPYFSEGLGAALTVMSTRMRTGRPSAGLAGVDPGSAPNRDPCAGAGSSRSNVTCNK